MVYYFSGTGNSRFVAESLSQLVFEKCKKITCINPANEIPEGKSVGFVFPVYSWGVATEMTSFIDNLGNAFWNELKRRQIYVWCVMTCGDEVALAPEMIAKTLSRHGVELESVWSVTMPNNYVLLPGFDVDPKKVERRKLEEAPSRIREIANGINCQTHKIDVVRGSWAWAKTKLIYPLFLRWGISPQKWHNTTSCVGCGICAKSCPLKNVWMENGVPKWGIDCCSCLACYHSCPRHAVEYGKITFKKGQYFCPLK